MNFDEILAKAANEVIIPSAKDLLPDVDEVEKALIGGLIFRPARNRFEVGAAQFFPDYSGVVFLCFNGTYISSYIREHLLTPAQRRPNATEIEISIKIEPLDNMPDQIHRWEYCIQYAMKMGGGAPPPKRPFDKLNPPYGLSIEFWKKLRHVKMLPRYDIEEDGNLNVAEITDENCYRELLTSFRHRLDNGNLVVTDGRLF